MPDFIGAGEIGERRDIGGRLFEFDGWHSGEPYWLAMDSQCPAVLCQCGQTMFELGYEESEFVCRAFCLCGRSFVVHEG